MTSPAQLKYLDAIGIPVWVSRERLVPVDNKVVTEKKQSSDSSYCIGSADDILQSLEQQPIRKGLKREAQPEQTPATINSPFVAEIPVSTESQQANEIGRTDQHILYACGNLNADWLVIGESPETSEERQNQPFANDSGVLLSNMLRSVGIPNPREDAYLINVLKQPSSIKEGDNSVTLLNQILQDKIATIKPKIILIVGQMSAQNLLQTKEPLARLRSKAHRFADTNIPVVVTYYPSYLLSKPLDKRKAWDDLKLAMSLMAID